MEVGTLKELNVKPGDVVQVVGGKSWEIIGIDDDGNYLINDPPYEEKGALLLAHHEGKVIELYNTFGLARWVDCAYPEDYWNEDIAYRVKPKQVRGVVTITSSDVSWGFMAKALRYHRITFETVDGKPDCSTIRMKALR
jgi:hypothetical protein